MRDLCKSLIFSWSGRNQTRSAGFRGQSRFRVEPCIIHHTPLSIYKISLKFYFKLSTLNFISFLFILELLTFPNY